IPAGDTARAAGASPSRRRTHAKSARCARSLGGSISIRHCENAINEPLTLLLRASCSYCHTKSFRPQTSHAQPELDIRALMSDSRSALTMASPTRTGRSAPKISTTWSAVSSKISDL
ncbi:unnamed protein product, partial [Ixodes pacificus]